jgi:CRP/FNR family transcriptional regulator, cyclic AMP receptor protein
MVGVDLQGQETAVVATCVCRHSQAAHRAHGGCGFCRCEHFRDPAELTRMTMEGLSGAAALALELLKAQPLFKNIQLGHLRELVQHGAKREFAKGEFLMRQGDQSDCIHIILQGQVKIEHRTRTGALGVAVLSQGEPVGEMGVLLDDNRNSSAIAQSLVETLRIEADDVRMVFDNQSDVLEAFVLLVQRRNRMISTRSWG